MYYTDRSAATLEPNAFKNNKNILDNIYAWKIRSI